MARILYLHGYASSPQSTKARLFAERFAALGVTLETPLLTGLTVTEQLALVGQIAGGEEVSLIGSSLGAYVAAVYAARHADVRRLVLLAPAFGFAQRWASSGEAGIDWPVVNDAMKYPAAPDVSQPTLLFHGVHDDVVPIEAAFDFARGKSNVTLHQLDSDHQLHNVAGAIFEAARAFLV